MSAKGNGNKTSARTGRRLHGAIAQHLGRAIVSGEIAPGERLTGEVDNAARLDVSRSAYREAVQALVAKGLVESRTKAGTRVLPRARWNLLDPEVLAWAFAGEPDPGFVRDLFELRMIVEPAAARFAAQRRTEPEVVRLTDAMERMARHTLASEEGQAADRDFHDILLHATHNDALISLSASITAAVAWTTRFKQRNTGLPRDPVPDHEAVGQAIAAQDPAIAENAMRTLVTLAFEDTLGAMESRDGGRGEACAATPE